MDNDGYEVFDMKKPNSEKAEQSESSSEKTSGFRKIEIVKTVIISFIAVVCCVTLGFTIKIYTNIKQQNDNQQVVVLPNSGGGFNSEDDLYVADMSEISEDDLNRLYGETVFTDSTTSVYIGGNTNLGVGTGSAVSTTAAAVKTTTKVQTTASPAVSGKVNINTASAETLMTLAGIGEVKSQAIIDYRTQNGPFSSPEQITNVSGIGEKTYEKIKDLITV